MTYVPPRLTGVHRLNHEIAFRLEEAADLLDGEEATHSRVNAFHAAAATVAALQEDVGMLVDKGGLDALWRLPHVSKGVASAIHEMARTGRWSLLERLRGTLDPVQLFRTVPGVGAGLARRIHTVLQIETLEALESAAFDGRLRTIDGIGRRRLEIIQGGLTALLGHPRLRLVGPRRQPALPLVLEIDREYRLRAAAGMLPLLAPRRFNPSGKPWLPVMHLDREGWEFTAMFSNSAEAHRLGATRDWVNVYHYDRQLREGQHTIVTVATTGHRTIRGFNRHADRSPAASSPAGVPGILSHA